VPYDARRYYARSSAVLVEALSAGVPVIVPAGSWMADQIQSEIAAYHLQLVEHANQARCLPAETFRWRSTDDAEIEPMDQGRLSFGGQRWRSFAWPRPRPNETHLVISFTIDAATPPGAYIRLHVEQLGEDDSSVARQVAILGRSSEGQPCTLLVELRERAARLWVGFSNAFDEAAAAVENVRLNFLVLDPRREAGRQPHSAVGAIFAESSDLAPLLGEMIDHHLHYRATAVHFAERWVHSHNPQRLVTSIVARADQPVGRPLRPTRAAG
jgi:hypothetical protein